jgi:energy-coupling factor transport system permease protein
MMEYVHRHSIIHDLNPLTKLLWSVVVLFLALILDSPWYLIAIIISVMIVGAIGKVGKETLVYMGGLLAISVVVFLFQVLFRQGGEVYFTIFPSSWPVVGGWLPVTEVGVLYGIAMSLRVMCIVSPFSVILSTTQPRDIIMALVEKLHVPYDFAFLFTTTLRFIPVVAAEVNTISQAQRSRAYPIEGWNPIRKIQALIPISMPIVFIAIEKADRLGLCMDLRGYGSKNRTYVHVFRISFADWFAMTIMFLAIVGGIVAAVTGAGRMNLPQ